MRLADQADPALWQPIVRLGASRPR